MGTGGGAARGWATMRVALPLDLSRRGAAQLFRDHPAGLAVVAALAVAGATLAHDRLFHAVGIVAGEAKPAEAGHEEPRPPGFDPATMVALAEPKFAAAEIRVEAARTAEVGREVAVAGRIEADPNRRIEVRPQAPGVVRTVPALPGTKVKAGDVLVVLESAEVAAARLLIRERQRALATARAEATFKAQVADNTETMIARLRQGASAQDLAKQFADKLVGTSRGMLIAAWTEVELAEHEFHKQDDLRKQNIVGEHPVFVAQHTLEGANERFRAVLEQARFDVTQADRIARQAVRNAEGMVVEAAERLRVLGVAVEDAPLLAEAPGDSAAPADSAELASCPILAPIDGVVVTTTTTRSRRVDVLDPLFVVADLSRVHAVANVPESDFAALAGLAGGAVRLTAEAAYPGRSFDARMLYAGAEVDPATRTVRLVAEVDNPDGLLRLGMFARIALDSRAVDRVTVVPPGALVDFDGVPAVFRPDPKEPRTFARRPVKLGRSTPEGQVIAEGLKPGDPVVVAGAFLLKSELILQNDTEEE